MHILVLAVLTFHLFADADFQRVQRAPGKAKIGPTGPTGMTGAVGATGPMATCPFDTTAMISVQGQTLLRAANRILIPLTMIKFNLNFDELNDSNLLSVPFSGIYQITQWLFVTGRTGGDIETSLQINGLSSTEYQTRVPLGVVPTAFTSSYNVVLTANDTLGHDVFASQVSPTVTGRLDLVLLYKV